MMRKCSRWTGVPPRSESWSLWPREEKGSGSGSEGKTRLPGAVAGLQERCGGTQDRRSGCFPAMALEDPHQRGQWFPRDSQNGHVVNNHGLFSHALAFKLWPCLGA